MSAHLSWMIIRNNNAFLMKRRNISKPFSREPHNLTNLSSFRYSGLVHAKSMGVSAAPDKKGFAVEWRTRAGRGGKRPARGKARRAVKGGARRALYRLGHWIRATGYRSDLARAALRRASAVLRSQRRLKPRAKQAAATQPAPAPAASS